MQITAEFTDWFPSEGAEMHRNTTRRRLFAQCVCKLENELEAARETGRVDNRQTETFAVERTVTEAPDKSRGMDAHDRPAFIKMTVKAVFTF